MVVHVKVHVKVHVEVHLEVHVEMYVEVHVEVFLPCLVLSEAWGARGRAYADTSVAVHVGVRDNWSGLWLATTTPLGMACYHGMLHRLF